MVLPPPREFSEDLDLLPILRDDNNTEEAYKWAWFNAIASILRRDGIQVTIPVHGSSYCTEDGTIKIKITTEACAIMGLKPADPLLGTTINIGVEAKRSAYSVNSSWGATREAAFAQRVWYDAHIYKGGQLIDAIAVCNNTYFTWAYKKDNKEPYYMLIDWYLRHPEIKTPCKVYEAYPDVKDICKLVKWRGYWFPHTAGFSVKDMINALFTDMLNGSDVNTTTGREIYPN